jgi:PKD domain
MRVSPLATLLCALAGAAAFVAGPAAPGAAAESCNREDTPIFDGGGYIYDFAETFEGYGEPVSGGSNGPADVPPGPVATSGAWNFWGDVHIFAPGADLTKPTAEDRYQGPDTCAFALGGQEIVYPAVPMHGLEVQHRWYVDPGVLHGARILTVLRNTGALPISATVLEGDASNFDQLGSGPETVSRATSDGTGTFSAASLWGVSTDEGLQAEPDPALAHVWGGPGGAIRASEVVLGNSKGRGVLYWTWNVTVPPGGIAAFISYEIQAAVPGRDKTAEVAQAVAQADARQKQAPASLYIGMSAAEIAATMNWAHPVPTAAIAPIGKVNAAKPVPLDGRASLAATGLPQCAISGYSWLTDDGAKGAGAMLPHFFAPGKHEATLVVTSNCGGTATAKASFSVASGLRLGKVKLNRKAGTAKLTVNALGAGKLSLSGKGLKKQAKQLKKAGNAVLTLKPTGKALKALRRKGKAKVRVTAALLPKGGKTSRLSKTVVLHSLVK